MLTLSAIFNFTFDYTRILQVSVLQAIPSLLNRKAWECNIGCPKFLGSQVQFPLCWIYFALPYISLYCQLCIIKGKLENGHTCLQQVGMFLVNLIKTIRSTWYGKVMCGFSFVRIKLFRLSILDKAYNGLQVPIRSSDNWVFRKCFQFNDKNIYTSCKNIIRTYNLRCERSKCYHRTNKTMHQPPVIY